MRLLTLAHLLSLLTFAALPLAASLPKYPRRFYYGGISKQLEKRAYFSDVSQFDFAPFNVTELRIFCDRLNRTVDYACNLTCKKNHAPSRALLAREDLTYCISQLVRPKLGATEPCHVGQLPDIVVVGRRDQIQRHRRRQRRHRRLPMVLDRRGHQFQGVSPQLLASR